MTDDDYRRKLKELDRLVNDPDLPLQPAVIWRLAAEVSARSFPAENKDIVSLTP